MTNWTIELNQLALGGFAPAYYKETYPSYGNKNQAGAMLNMDLTNPGSIMQGPGLANLTNGTQAAAVTTLIKGIFNYSVLSDTTYGVGGNKLYKISSSAVASDGTWPHTIDKAAVTGELGEDVAEYRGTLYYTYNHSGGVGDIGTYDLNATFDDDWGSTVPSGAGTLQYNSTFATSHQMVVGGNDTLYIANGRYVASYDATTLILQALDLPPSSFIQSLTWSSDRLWIAANRYNFSLSTKAHGSIYVWDGTTDSWETEIPLTGTVGGIYVKNGVVYVFYSDITSTGGYKLAYVNGNSVVDLANFTGALPAFYQITDYKDFLVWDANGSLYAFGAGDVNMPVRFFQYADSGYATAGGIAAPFGTLMVASWDAGSNYKLAQLSGYDTNSNWKSLMFDLTAKGRSQRIDTIRINFELLTAGARVDWKLLNNAGVTVYSDTISYTKLGAVTGAWYNIGGTISENFRLEFDFTNGSTSAPVKIKNAKVYGSSE